MTQETGARHVVLKFGGTSVSTRDRWEVIEARAQACLAEGLAPVVVCSAVTGVSNLLESLMEQAPGGHHAEDLEAIVEAHRRLAEDLDLDMEALIGDALRELEQVALGISLIGEVSPRLHARIMASGELMSTRLGAAFLAARGMAVTWVDARTCLTSVAMPGEDVRRQYTSAVCGDEADPRLQARLQAIGGVILTQGFIASNEHGETVILGRGGSDTSASLLAARLQAVRCEIWTDVPGMFTANPRQLQSARLLKSLSYDEAQEIASTGAKVLHPRCIPPVRRHGIELQVRCTTDPDLPGTVVSTRPATATAHVKAISSKGHQTLISMDTPGMWQQVGFLADVFTCFKHHGLSVDLVSTSEMNVTVSLDPASNNLDDERLSALKAELGRHCRVRTIGPCAAISLVGHNIRAILHRLGPTLEVFEAHHIHLVSQAASDLNLTFVVDEGQAERLTRRLHAHLFQGEVDDAVFGPTWEALSSPSQPDPDDIEAPAPPALPWWRRRRDELLALAAEHSPRYVYDADTLDAAASALTSMESVDRIFYALKANPNAEILTRFERLGLGFECVSPGELAHVRGLFPELDPERILFTPNFAPRHEYAEAFELGVHVTLDNLHPLESWPEVFAGRAIMVRIDPGQGRGHHDYVKTAGARSKFGVSVAQLDRLAELASRVDARIVGLHAHTGSGILTPDEWADTALFLAHVAERFPSVRRLDLGGGLGVPEKPAQAALDLGAVDERLATFRAANPRFELWMEPGRYLVAQAGVLLTRVTQLKDKGSVRYVGVDTGMNSLIRPALYGAFHQIVNLSRVDQTPTWTGNVVGPICESGDTLGYDRRLAPPQEGDVLLLATAGAYGRAMSSRYNLREPAAETTLPNKSE